MDLHAQATAYCISAWQEFNLRKSCEIVSLAGIEQAKFFDYRVRNTGRGRRVYVQVLNGDRCTELFRSNHIEIVEHKARFLVKN